MAYFDNAATTYPKPEVVYSYMDMFYRSNGASAGRGKYGASVSAGALIAETRQLIQDLMHCQAKQVVFTPTATVALNIVLQGLTGVKMTYVLFLHLSIMQLHAPCILIVRVARSMFTSSQSPMTWSMISKEYATNLKVKSQTW